MRNRFYWCAALACVCFLVTLFSCDVEKPDRYVRPPIIKSFAPTSSSLSSVLGDSVEFSIAAIDPDKQRLSYYFLLGDSVAWNDSQWTYVVNDTGDIDIGGRVTNGTLESAIKWHMKRVRPVNLPPVIVGVIPPEPQITMIVGGSLEFSISAEDPEGKPLSHVYTIDEAIVSVTRKYTFQATTVDTVVVRAVVSDGESFVSHVWTVRVAAEPDFTPPSTVPIRYAAPGVETGEVDFEWTAVGDDGMTGLPSYYVVRTSPRPITDEFGWTSASDRPGEPAPVLPGGTMRMTVSGLPPAQLVYVAVRAVDDFGNMSPLSALTSARVRGMNISGTVRDAISGSPLERIRVALLSVADTTSADGVFELKELPAGVGFIKVEDEGFITIPGNYFDLLVSPYAVVDEDVRDFSLIPNVPLVATQYSTFLEWYLAMTDMDATSIDLLDRWEIPCRVYVPPKVKNGIDFQQTMKDAFDEWEDLTGINMFEFVDAVPDTGVYVDFVDITGDVDSYIVTRREANYLTIQGRIDIRTLYTLDQIEVLRVVTRHEVGHVIGLNHSLDIAHIMIGGRFPAVDHPTTDEIQLVRAMYSYPRGFAAAWLRDD